jgi:hypothetical protein
VTHSNRRGQIPGYHPASRFRSRSEGPDKNGEYARLEDSHTSGTGTVMDRLTLQEYFCLFRILIA